MGTVADYIGCRCTKKSQKDNNENEIVKDLEDSCSSMPSTIIKIRTQEFVREMEGDVFKIYKKKDLLGEGSFGAVYSVIRNNLDSTNHQEIIRALKIIDKKRINMSFEGSEEIKNEINVLKTIDHPNVMKIYEFYEDEQNIYVIAEFCDVGDLGKILDKYGVFPEFLVKYIMYQVFIGITILHFQNVVHSDLKAENIAFVTIANEKMKMKTNVFEKIIKDKEIREELNKSPSLENLCLETIKLVKELSNYEIKIVDFGSAKINKKHKKLSGITGTAYYCSPEIIHEKYSFPCDEWACGVMMYILLSGIPPFQGDTEDEIFENVLNSEPNLDIEELKDVSPECKDLISKLLQKDSKKRITAKEALKHPFFEVGIHIKNLITGKWKDNAEILNVYAKSTVKSIKTNPKKKKFKEAVIAYIVYKFTDKNEQKKIKEVFREISSENPNYLITRETFVNYMKKTCKNFTDEEINNLYCYLDQNNSGNIEYEELNRALCNKENLLCEKNLIDAFNFFDVDNSGKISLDEVATIVAENQKLPPDIVDDFLKEFGKDKNDTSINYQEFLKIVKG